MLLNPSVNLQLELCWLPLFVIGRLMNRMAPTQCHKEAIPSTGNELILQQNSIDSSSPSPLSSRSLTSLIQGLSHSLHLLKLLEQLPPAVQYGVNFNHFGYFVHAREGTGLLLKGRGEASSHS